MSRAVASTVAGQVTRFRGIEFGQFCANGGATGLQPAPKRRALRLALVRGEVRHQFLAHVAREPSRGLQIAVNRLGHPHVQLRRGGS